MIIAEVVKLVLEEVGGADALYGDFASMHEGYGVLAEEVSELFDAVRLKAATHTFSGRSKRISEEAIQVAAVALRIAAQADRVRR